MGEAEASSPEEVWVKAAGLIEGGVRLAVARAVAGCERHHQRVARVISRAAMLSAM